jgi:Cof subfamily protein (haloacid dehalogenase superfamily)
MTRPAGRIAMLLSDVDGTLVTRDKRVTEATVAAVHRLADAGIQFAITSSRPPAGLAGVVAQLGIATPIAGFNGGMIVDRHGVVLEQQTLDSDSAATTVATLERFGADIWVFEGNQWWLTNELGSYVAKETRTNGYGPKLTTTFAGHLDRVTKIVGSSDDPARLIDAEHALQELLGNHAAISLSQPYYLDITHAEANKGSAVRSLGNLLGISVAEIATIGDGENDLRMFAAGGFAIAMGNGNAAVQAGADRVTRSNEEDGFAHAVEQFILPH